MCVYSFLSYPVQSASTVRIVVCDRSASTILLSTHAFDFLYKVRLKYRVAQKERMSLGPHAHQIYLPAISFFGVTSNQKSLRSKTSYSRRSESFHSRRNCNCATTNVSKCDAELWGEATVCVRQEGRHLSDIIFRNWVMNVSNRNCIYYRLFWC